MWPYQSALRVNVLQPTQSTEGKHLGVGRCETGVITQESLSVEYTVRAVLLIKGEFCGFVS
jgi:hypothetical protein